MLLHFLQSKLDVTIVYSLSEWNGSVIHVWVYLQLRNDSLARDLFLWKIPDTVQVCYAAIIPKPNYAPFSLSASIPIRLDLPLWAGVDIAILGEANEKQSSRVSFFQRCRGHH